MRVSIRLRLTLIYSAVFSLTIILLEFGAYAGLSASVYSLADSELHSRLSGVTNFLDEHIWRRTARQMRAETAAHGALKPDLLGITTSENTEIFRGHLIGGTPWRGGAPFDGAGPYCPLRILQSVQIVRGQQYFLTVAEDWTVPSAILHRFLWLEILSFPIVVAGASLAGWLISKRALRPVANLITTAHSLNAANLAERVPVPDTGDEIQQLAQTLNEMFERIESAFRHVTQFTANASHELRAPLALIRTTSEVALLRPDSDVEGYRDALHNVLREATKNSALLDDLLRLARADSAGSIELRPLEFGPHIVELCERVSPLAEERNLRLDILGGPSSLLVCAHASTLGRLWLILLDNAIKYTPPGGRITVSWQLVKPAGSAPSQVCCEIRDSGIGIAEEDLPHIFERFYRADKARSRDQGGVGLGLALAHWIVNAHRGRIAVESKLGAGSAFRVYLALASVALPAAYSASPRDKQLNYNQHNPVDSIHSEGEICSSSRAL